MFSSFSIEGKGVHTGCQTKVHVESGIPGSGVVFVRRQQEIPALPKNISGRSERATSLECGGVSVRTVEHLLAALVVLAERDVRVTVEGGEEIPILDGSAQPWIKSFIDNGAKEDVSFVAFAREMEVHYGESFVRLFPATPLSAPRYEVHLDFGDHTLGSQKFSFRPGVDNFAREVAPARTFARLEEIENLWSRGLAQGGDLDSALVIGPQGVINPDGGRFSNEPARHKMLDALGDLSLLGGLPFANMYFEKPGHRLLHEFVAQAQAALANPKGDPR